jgi:hypothetical protein
MGSPPINNKLIDSFAWMEHIRSPTQLTFSSCNFTSESVASLAHISNPYITSLTIDCASRKPDRFVKSILTATPQLHFLTLFSSSQREVQECLDYLPAGCQVNFALSSAIPIERQPIIVRIAYGIASFKAEDLFNCNYSSRHCFVAALLTMAGQVSKNILNFLKKQLTRFFAIQFTLDNPYKKHRYRSKNRSPKAR